MPTFTGGSQHDDSDWNTGSNWDTQQVPQDGDDVTIGDDTDWALPEYPGGNLTLGSLTIGKESLIMLGGAITCTDNFSLSGTFADGGTIIIAGSGVISCGVGDEAPSLGNSSALVVTGSLAITGPGTFEVGGGNCTITNNGLMTFTDCTFDWPDGSNPIIANNGQIDILGDVVWTGGDISNSGTLTIPAGSSLDVSRGCILRTKESGAIFGAGKLIVGDPEALGYSCELSVEGDTILPKGLTFELISDGIVTTDITDPNPPSLQVQGTLNLIDGTLIAMTYLVATATCTVTGTLGAFYGGKFQNLGTITVAQGKTLNLTSGITLLNMGRFTLSGGSTVKYTGGSVTFDNAGLVVSSGKPKNTIDAITLDNAGNIIIKSGTLDLIDGSVITMTAGVLDIAGTTLDSSDKTATLELSGGTTGGVVRGHGVINAAVTNGGMLEPDGTGITLGGRYDHNLNGALVVTTPSKGVAAPLTVKGAATVSGALFIRTT